MASASFPCSFQRNPQIVVRLGKLRFELQSPLITRCGFGRLSLVLENVAEADVGLGEIGLQMQSPLITRHGFGQLPQVAFQTIPKL